MDKQTRKRLIWAFALFIAFTMVVGTFCYSLGKTDTFREAVGDFFDFWGIGLTVLLAAVALPAFANIFGMGKQD